MKLHMVSLGCDKNRVDSEKLLQNLLVRYPGSEITEDPEEADIAIINTCSFIGPAKEESINTIIEIGGYKKSAQLKKLIVAGCLVERYREEIRKELPEVDEVIAVRDYVDKLDIQMARVSTADMKTQYLKIAEGCDKYCSYCIIPKLRGHYRSVPMEHLLKEAEELAALGTKELILVAQETTLYGTDLYGRKALPELLHRLGEIEGIRWIRLLYCYPEEIEDSLIAEIKRNPKVCHYLDIPIQHSSDKILKSMRRRTRESELREVLEKLRREIPDIVLRTTVITGFPGETEEDFASLLQFLREESFERLGAFPYSLMACQQEIAFARARQQIGRKLEVRVEYYDPERECYVTRSYMDAPDIDSFVYVPSHTNRRISGDMLWVQVTDSDGYDLIGEML